MKLGMVIDLSRCVGCGACALACKAENNTRDRANGQSFNWADFTMRTEGVFPDVVHRVMPVLCNHCTDAPCVKACPETPKAMYKTPEGITMHDPSRCIGCQYCQEACPYSAIDLDASSFDGAGYSVISYNEHRENTQPKWSERDSMIPNGTSSGSEVAKLSGAAVPAMNEFETSDVTPIRKSGVIEKCTFCSHRTLNGLPPACVEACPAKARIFGDQDDPNSEIAKALKTQRSFVLKPEAKTRPNVFYIGKYSARER